MKNFAAPDSELLRTVSKLEVILTYCSDNFSTLEL